MLGVRFWGLKLAIGILILFSIFWVRCEAQTLEDTEEYKEAQKDVSESLERVKSKDFQELIRRIEQEEKISAQLSERIDRAGSAQFISSKDSINHYYNGLITQLEDLIMGLREKHGTKKDGTLKDKMNADHVNTIFIEAGNARDLKTQMLITTNKSLEIAEQNEIKLNKEDLPLYARDFSEREGLSWEEYFFKDMPATAIMPLLKRFESDVKLSKLILLESLEGKL